MPCHPIGEACHHLKSKEKCPLWSFGEPTSRHLPNLCSTSTNHLRALHHYQYTQFTAPDKIQSRTAARVAFRHREIAKNGTTEEESIRNKKCVSLKPLSSQPRPSPAKTPLPLGSPQHQDEILTERSTGAARSQQAAFFLTSVRSTQSVFAHATASSRLTPSPDIILGQVLQKYTSTIAGNW